MSNQTLALIIVAGWLTNFGYALATPPEKRAKIESSRTVVGLVIFAATVWLVIRILF